MKNISELIAYAARYAYDKEDVNGKKLASLAALELVDLKEEIIKLKKQASAMERDLKIRSERLEKRTLALKEISRMRGKFQTGKTRNQALYRRMRAEAREALK